MHTEDEAKKLWCPMVRFTPDTEGYHCLNNREEPLTRSTMPGSLSRCIASGCAMWVWEPGRAAVVQAESQRDQLLSEGFQYTGQQVAGKDVMKKPAHLRRGMCGLAGRPE